MFTSFLQSSPIESHIPQALSLAGPQRPSRQKHIERCTLPPTALKPAQDNANHDRPWHIWGHTSYYQRSKVLYFSSSPDQPFRSLLQIPRSRITATPTNPPNNLPTCHNPLHTTPQFPIHQLGHHRRLSHPK